MGMTIFTWGISISSPFLSSFWLLNGWKDIFLILSDGSDEVPRPFYSGAWTYNS